MTPENAEGMVKALPTRGARKRRGEAPLGPHLLMAAASGLLGCLSFPRLSWHVFIWFAFVPLLLAVKARGPRTRFVLGLTTGSVGFFGAFYWVGGSAARFLNVSFFAAALLFVLFVLWYAIQFGLFAVLLRTRPGTLSAILLPACLWVPLESGFPAVFPWRLGNVLQPHGPFIQLAAVTGVAGLSFAVMLVNSLLAAAWECRQQRTARLALIAAAALVIAALEVHGRYAVAQVEAAERGVQRLRVALIQGNVSPVWEADAEFVQKSLRVYADLSSAAAEGRPDLIIWPEAALRTDLTRDSAVLDGLFAVAEKAHTNFLVGARNRSEAGDALTSAFLVSPYGNVFGVYDKTRLVPFAEYLPWGFRFLKRWWPGETLGRGTDPGPLLLPGTRTAPSICYEATFPGFFRPAIERGAEFLVNITNDAWFGDSSGPYHHLQAAVMRAVESRRWLLRAANSGVSAFIAPTGRIVSRTELFTQTTLQGEVLLVREQSVYVTYGDWFVYVCLGGAVLLLVASTLGTGTNLTIM